MINNKEEILNLLKESIPNRFMNLDPFRFESFIATLFKNMGYNVIETKKVGDYGADIIIENSTEKIAVQVKRYEENNKVGVQEINQVIGAKNFYNCGKAQLVTTSSFSPQGLRLSEKTDVILWDWEMLYECIKKTFLEGKDIYNFFKEETPITEEDNYCIQGNFVFNIDRIEENVVLGDDNNTEATIVHIKMRNNTNKKISIELGRLPSIIDKLGNQFKASWQFRGCFEGGDIFPKCTVTLSFCWLKRQIPSPEVIRQIVIDYTENNKNKKCVIINYVPEYTEFSNIIDKDGMLDTVDKLVLKYKRLGKIPPHILIKGTLEARNILLAESVAVGLGYELIQVIAASIVSLEDIFRLLVRIDRVQGDNKNVVLFIKDVNNLKYRPLWCDILNNFIANLGLKDQTIYIDGKKSKIIANSTSVKSPFMAIATTTSIENIDKPFLDSFPIQFLLNEYKEDDILRITKENAQKNGIKIDDEAILYIAQNSTCIPEIAIDCLPKLKDKMIMKGADHINKDLVIEAFQTDATGTTLIR